MEMGVPVNYFAIIIAAVASMVIGYVWYGPFFGKMWVKEMGWSKSEMDKKAKKEGMGKLYLLMFLGSLVMSWVLAHAYVFASTYLNLFGLGSGATAGFYNWLGFVLPVTLGSVLWEGKKVRLFAINNGYYLLTLMVMGMIIAVMS